MADTYKVQDGDQLDSLWKISKAYGVSFQELKNLNPELKDREPPFTIKGGDVIQLPPRKDTGELCKTVEDCKIKRCKLLAIALDRNTVAPTPTGKKATTSFELCSPAVFKVTKTTCKPPPTANEKKQIRWFVRDAKTKDDLMAASPGSINEAGDELVIECVPFDWQDRIVEIGAQFNKPPKMAMFSGTPTGNEILTWIATVQRAEKAYSGLSPFELTAAMRSLSLTDNSGFRRLFGGSAPGIVLTPAPPLTQADIDNLIDWTRHRPTHPTDPHPGVRTDAKGEVLTPSHVLTGITAGMTRNRMLDPTPGGSANPFGAALDNLFAVTISGDLGQSAAFVKVGKQSKPYTGPASEASEPELVGDIDGFLIGDSISGTTTSKLSEILLDYYCPCSKKPVNFRNRFKSFTASGLANLPDQILRFAKDFLYVSEGKWTGATTGIGTQCEEAFKEFEPWLKGKTAKE